MELALLGDIHSNLPALRAVLKDIGHAEIFCLGDIVGYNPFPRETIDLLRKMNVSGVRGNHDQAAIDRRASFLNPTASEALIWTNDQLKEEDRLFLEGFPMRYVNGLLRAYHGSSRDPLYEYMYPWLPEETFRSLSVGVEMLFLGHTHVPYVKMLKDKLIVNPGSVGQPRDGDPKASYSIVDKDSGKAEIRRVEYDIDTVAGEIYRQRLPTFLAKRLYLGK